MYNYMPAVVEIITRGIASGVEKSLSIQLSSQAKSKDSGASLLGSESQLYHLPIMVPFTYHLPIMVPFSLQMRHKK